MDFTVRIQTKRISKASHGIKASDAISRLPPNADESATDQDLAVWLYRDCKDRIAKSVRIKRVSQAGRGIKPRNAVTRLSADAVRSAEKTARQDPAVPLDRDCKNIALRIRLERISQAGGGIQPGHMSARLSANAVESAASQNLAVSLHRDGLDHMVRVWVERISQAGRSVESGNVIAMRSAHVGKGATHKNFPVGLYRDGIDRVTVRPRVERISQAGGGIKPRDEIALLSANGAEKTARQYLAILLHCDGEHRAVRAGVERGVERAVRVQPGNKVGRHVRCSVWRQCCKVSAEQNFAVRLDYDNVNPAIRARVEIVEDRLSAQLYPSTDRDYRDRKHDKESFLKLRGCTRK